MNLFKSSVNLFKSSVIQELEDKCNRIDNLTLEEAQSGIIESASKEINTRYMRDNRKSELKTCIESLKKKIDEFYTLFKYDEDKLEIGKEYFELSNDPYKYNTLGTYIETKNFQKKETGGFGFVTTVTHLGAVFTQNTGLWKEPDLGSKRVKIYTLKSIVNLNTPPPSLATSEVSLQDAGRRTRRRKTRRPKRSRKRSNRKARKSRRRR